MRTRRHYTRVWQVTQIEYTNKHVWFLSKILDHLHWISKWNEIDFSWVFWFVENASWNYFIEWELYGNFDWKMSFITNCIFLQCLENALLSISFPSLYPLKSNWFLSIVGWNTNKWHHFAVHDCGNHEMS